MNADATLEMLATALYISLQVNRDLIQFTYKHKHKKDEKLTWYSLKLVQIQLWEAFAFEIMSCKIRPVQRKCTFLFFHNNW